MNRFDLKRFLAVTLASGFSLLSAATPVIGVAMSQGAFSVDSGRTPGTATIFDGNVLQTESTASQVRLKDGARVQLASESRGKLFSDHVDLIQGSALVSGYGANASGLKVRTEASGSANVSIHGKTVQVAAVTGNVHVFNAAGVNVANVSQGKALDLVSDDAGATSLWSMSGCVRSSSNKLVLTDETSQVAVQLQGAKTAKAGRRMQVTGEVVSQGSPVAGASQVLNVSTISDEGSCTAPVTQTAVAHTPGAPSGVAAAAGAAGVGAGAAGAGAGAAATGAAVAGAATSAGVSSAVVVAGVAAAAATLRLPSVQLAPTGGLGTSGGAPVCSSPCTF